MDISIIYELVTSIFPTSPLLVERVAEGVSTYVYRIVFQHEPFYLRILPEEGASFAPEVVVHLCLRQLQVKVPEVIYFDHCYAPLRRSIMVTTEIKGVPLSASSGLFQNELAAVTYEHTIRFVSILINVRALVRSLQKHPPNRYTQHQLKVLREDIAELLV